MSLPPTPAAHPPVGSTKALAAFALSVVGLGLSPVIGGIVPAALALILAEQASADIASARGFLTGERYVAYSKPIAWIAVWLSVLVGVSLSVYALLNLH